MGDTIKVVRVKNRLSARNHGNPDPADIGKVREISRASLNIPNFLDKNGFVLYEEPIKEETKEPTKEETKEVKKSK